LLTINPPASISSLGSSSSAPGQSLTVTITGQYSNFFQGSTQATFGAGISVGGAAAGGAGPVTVVSATTATAQLVIDGAAVPGARDVIVRTGAEVATLPGGFTVAGTPVISQVNPTRGSRGRRTCR
jgi:hypothetical protein